MEKKSFNPAKAVVAGIDGRAFDAADVVVAVKNICTRAYMQARTLEDVEVARLVWQGADRGEAVELLGSQAKRWNAMLEGEPWILREALELR